MDWEGILKSNQEKNKACMVEDLAKDPSRFVINQLLLSYQFWTNFETYVKQYTSDSECLE